MAVFGSLLCKVLQKWMTSNSKIQSRNNLGIVSPPKYEFVIKDAVNLLSTQISSELFILTFPLPVPSPFSWLSSCSGFAELRTTTLSSTAWRDNVGRAWKDFLGMRTSHEEPGKDCRPSPPEDKDGTWASEGGAGSGTAVPILQHQYNSGESGLQQQSSFWSKEVGEAEGARQQGKDTSFAQHYRGWCLGGLPRTEHLFFALIFRNHLAKLWYCLNIYH